MKTKFYSIVIAAAFASAFASCTKESSEITTAPVLKASIEATRTTLDRVADGGKVLWVANDEISVNGSIYVATPDADATRAEFTLKAGQASANSPYVAYYPASIVSESTVTLPEVQIYSEASLANVAPMYAASENEDLLFHNICGLLEIVLKGDKAVKSIEISADEALSGEITVDENFNAVIKDGAEVKGVKLDCGEGVALAENGTKFYIAVPVAQYHHLKVTVINVDGDEWSKESTGVANVQRNLIYTLPFDPTYTPAVTTVLAKWSWTGLLQGSSVEALQNAAKDWVTGTHTFNSDAKTGGVFKGVSPQGTDWSVGTSTQKKDRLRVKNMKTGDYFQFEAPIANASAGATVAFSGVCVCTTSITNGPINWVEEYSVDGGTTWTNLKTITLTGNTVDSGGDLECTIKLDNAISNGKILIRVRNTTPSNSNFGMIVLKADDKVTSINNHYTDDWAYATITLTTK